MLSNKENKFAITMESVLAEVFKKVEAGMLMVNDDEYPVEFDECVDFMYSGQVIHGFGEIYGCCSYGLIDLIKVNPKIKDFIGSCIKRFLTGDMGDVKEANLKVVAQFHEGFGVGAEYETDLISEGRIILTTEEYVDDEIPRCIWATLPSEEKLVYEWYERHPEEYKG